MNKALNVLSNLIYAIAGGIAVYHSGGLTPFAFACFFLALGSAAFHHFFNSPNPDLRYWAHHADELGIYMVFSAALAMLYGIESWLILPIVWAHLHFVAGAANIHEVMAIMGTAIAAIMVYTGLYLELFTILVCFAFAYYVRSTDRFDFQVGHALWHLVTGVMIAMLYWFIFNGV